MDLGIGIGIGINVHTAEMAHRALRRNGMGIWHLGRHGMLNSLSPLISRWIDG